ncbi:MAG: ATP-binding protein [Candidatus Delongbacteria bacterium]
MYIKRNAESELIRLSNQFPVVTITGPRQSGKTTLCRHVFPDKKYISLEDIDNRNYALTDPRGFLSEYSGGVIIDEVQKAPDLLSYIQGIVDKNQNNGEFILTGSSQFELSRNISQSLAGRTALLRLLPFSYLEIYDSAENSVEWLNNVMYKGFYPRIHSDSLDAVDVMSAYIETYVERDVRQLYDVKDLNIFRMFLKLIAARTGQLLNYSNIADDCGVTIPTIKNWVSILEQSYIIFLLQPYHSNVKKRLIKTPKIYFYDVGLCAYLNGVKRAEHIGAIPIRGSLFENFVISEVLKMNAHNNFKDDFYFFRDKTKTEVDLLINKGIEILPYEIKSAMTFNSDFVKNLKYFSALTKTEKIGNIVYSGKTQQRSEYTVYNYFNFFSEYLNLT